MLVSSLPAAFQQYWQLCYNLCKYSCKLCANIHHSQGQARIRIIYDRAHTWPLQIMTMHTRGALLEVQEKIWTTQHIIAICLTKFRCLLSSSGSLRLSQALSGSYSVTLTLTLSLELDIKFGLPPPPPPSKLFLDSK